MPKCRTCTHYWSKAFPEMPWNYECHLGHDMPDYGDTDSCSDYEEQYTIGMEKGWSYEKEDKTYSHAEDVIYSGSKQEDAESYLSSSYSCSSSSSNSEIGPFGIFWSVIIGIIISISILSNTVSFVQELIIESKKEVPQKGKVYVKFINDPIRLHELRGIPISKFHGFTQWDRQWSGGIGYGKASVLSHKKCQ